MTFYLTLTAAFTEFYHVLIFDLMGLYLTKEI